MIGGVLGMGRSMAEARMTDRCRVTRPGPKTWDEDTGEWGFPQVTVFEGPCRVKHPSTGAADADAGSQLVVLSLLEVHLPVAADGVTAGDVVEVIASDTRAGEVGRRFHVKSAFDGSQTTALRYRVEAFDER